MSRALDLLTLLLDLEFLRVDSREAFTCSPSRDIWRSIDACSVSTSIIGGSVVLDIVDGNMLLVNEWDYATGRR